MDQHANEGESRFLVTVPAPDPDCWLHSGVEVRDSPIQGKGLFALEDIPAGAVVSRVGGWLVSGAELRAAFAAAALDPAHPYIDTITVADDVHLILPPRRPNGYGNHSCGPNLWWVDAYSLAALREIAAGEELTNDYATSTGVADFRMDCVCGSELCRGKVTGLDWQRADLQARYGGHWAPGLLELIRSGPQR